MKGYRHPYDADCTNDVDAASMKLDEISVRGCRWSELIELSEAMEPLACKVERILSGSDEEIGFGVKFQPHFYPTATTKWLHPLRGGALDTIRRRFISTMQSTSDAELDVNHGILTVSQ
jgi:hypothetical protein